MEFFKADGPEGIPMEFFKADGPEGIPMEFFKALIPCRDYSEKSSDNNSNISSGFKCLKALINRI